MNRFLLAVMAALLCGSFGTLARGQDSVLAELYGQGVHAYFAGDYSGADNAFTNAIAQGCKDPRCFYFRGLTNHRLGRTTEGNEDLKLGAVLEANSSERIYPVSDSLQRVQGRMRMQIEKQRQQARLAARSKQNQAEQARYEQMQRSDAGARTKPAPGAVAPAIPTVPDKTDPFASDAEVKPEKAPERPPAVAAEPKPEADPFGAAAAAAESPAATEKPAEAPADPFSTPAATPPAKDEATNPFSDDKPAAETPPPAEKPAEKAADDPFGE
jgi:hypothetical protein